MEETLPGFAGLPGSSMDLQQARRELKRFQAARLGSRKCQESRVDPSDQTELILCWDFELEFEFIGPLIMRILFFCQENHEEYNFRFSTEKRAGFAPWKV